MTDKTQYHPSHIVMEALGRLSKKNWKEIYGSAKDFFWWWRRVNDVVDVAAEAYERLEDGRRKFYVHKVDINDPSSLQAALLGVFKSIGDEIVTKLIQTDKSHVELGDNEENLHRLPDPRNPLSFLNELADTSVNYALTPEEILSQKQEHDESARLVAAFLSLLDDKKPLLRQVWEWKEAGMQIPEIAAHLKMTNKEIHNLMGDIRRYAIKFFSLRFDKAKNKYRKV